MTRGLVSVIVVSRGRPDALLRCLTGIEQLDFADFEVVAVADPAGLDRLSTAGFDGRIKTVAFAEPNISAARNRGLAVAAGDIAAFIDDDAVPEPTWLTHLSAAFHRPEVAAAGGYVIGRNGISFQNRGRRVDALGRHRKIALPDDAPAFLRGAPGDAIKTEGTNCAFRAGQLRDIGGFDPAFRFYLDETDVNQRFASKRLVTAIVPLAQVHHGFDASDRRLASRMPTTLFDIGASQAVYLRKHAPAATEAGLTVMRTEQRRRLLRFMVAGLCVPGDVGRLLRTLDDGIAEGMKRPVGRLPPLPEPAQPFLPFSGRRTYRDMRILSGRHWGAAGIRRAAIHELRRGHRVSLYLFSPTTLFHAVSFRPEGYWQQTGGLFGRSRRDGALFRWTSFARRVQEESARVGSVRGCDPPEPPDPASSEAGERS